jgi:benzoylformate decarboxylase
MEEDTAITASGPGGTGRMGAANPAAIAEAASFLREARHPLIVAGDGVAQTGADAALARLAEIAGAEVWFEPSRGRVPLDTNHAAVRGSLPFDTVATREIFAEADVFVLIGGRFFEELWFDPGGLFAQGAKTIEIEESYPALAHSRGVSVGLIGELGATISALADAVPGAADKTIHTAPADRLAAMKTAKAGAIRRNPPVQAASDRVSVGLAMETIRQSMPADTVIVDESFSTRRELNQALDFRGPADFFAGRGGGIGQGLAGAIGVQLAYPDRRVLAVSGDGSAMYAIQALWSAAHHDLPIIFLIMANGQYGVLKRNLDEWRRRFALSSNRPNPQMDIALPPLDFIALAQGMGVTGIRVKRNADLAPALRTAFDCKQPYLIELVI